MTDQQNITQEKTYSVTLSEQERGLLMNALNTLSNQVYVGDNIGGSTPKSWEVASRAHRCISDLQRRLWEAEPDGGEDSDG
jgi:hypothetical protein